MTKLTPSMRLKIKRDTFFLPELNRGVYFRNNVSSFHMEGSTIVQWVEKLLPMFNGDHTLEELTAGLPGPYRDRVCDIAEALYRNGFVQDVSQDRPHQLTDQVLKNHASQIEFLDTSGDSGAYRFQTYRQAKVLAIGSGPFFISLVSALLESGLPAFHTLITDTVPTNRRRLKELVANARKTEPEIAVKEVTVQKKGRDLWKEVVQPFDSVLYVSQEGDLEELTALHAVCRQEKKTFLPAICIDQVGIAGPLVSPDAKGDWESSWRRIHQPVFDKDQQRTGFSSTAGAMLANGIVFELLKEIAKVSAAGQKSQVFLLDLDSLEGNWHAVRPHPLVTGRAKAEWVQEFDQRIEQETGSSEPGRLFIYFSQLTSAQTGIFHRWEEGDLKQLPLAQCRVQVADPMSAGPADLLPEAVCAGLTHEEARRESGLTGIEKHVSQLLSSLIASLPPHKEMRRIDLAEFVGVGAGETFAECICRGLQQCLNDELSQQPFNEKNLVSLIQLDKVEDERCRYYLQSLTTMKGTPMIGLGREVSGFPVVWVGTGDSWNGCVGLNVTLALRDALQQAIMTIQNHAFQSMEVPTVRQKNIMPQKLTVPVCEAAAKSEILQSARQVLASNRKRLIIIQLELEPFVKEEPIEVYGVLLREEESR